MVLDWLKKKYEGLNTEGSLKVPGEKEALEVVRYHEKEWKRITKGINLRDLEGTRKMLKEAVHNYNQTQRLKPYGLYFNLSSEGVVEERKLEPLIEQSRTADYKITLSAKCLPTRNIEDLTLSEAKEYYEAIKKEIADLKEIIKEGKKMGASTENGERELYLAKERCALALRVIGELSGGTIPKNLLHGYKDILWNLSKKSTEENPGGGKEETTETTPEERLNRMQRRSEEIAEHIKPPYQVYNIEYNSIRYKSPYHEGSLFVDRLEDYETIQKILDDFTDAIRITQDILKTYPNIRKFYGFEIREIQTNENFLCPYVNLVVDIEPVGDYFGWGTSSIGQRGIKVYWHSPEMTKEYLKEGSGMIEATPPATTAHEMTHTLGSSHEIIDPLAKIVGLIFYLKHSEYVPQVTDFDWLCFEMVDVFSAYIRKDRVGIAREQLNALYKAAPTKVDECIKKELAEVDAKVIREWLDYQKET